MYRRKIKDAKILTLLDCIVDSYEASPGKGIPIGNLTSQYFANQYLSYLDHYAKQILGLRYWIRYMDDILVCHDSKSVLARVYSDVSAYCSQVLQLSIKPRVLGRTSCGAPFLGFLIQPTGMLLQRRTRDRFRKKAYKIWYHVRHFKLTQREAGDRITAMVAHIKLARTHAFRYHLFHGSLLGVEPRQSGRELEQ